MTDAFEARAKKFQSIAVAGPRRLTVLMRISLRPMRRSGGLRGGSSALSRDGDVHEVDGFSLCPPGPATARHRNRHVRFEFSTVPSAWSARTASETLPPCRDQIAGHAEQVGFGAVR